jgi:serine/threonine protein phosphatase PrpC
MGCSLAWAMICDRGTLRPENQDATLMWATGPAVTLPSADTARNAVSGSALLSAGAGGAGAGAVLAAVADGMGGPPGGAQASQVIVRTIAAGLPTGSVPDPDAFLKDLLEESNGAVYEQAHRHGLVGMGSTCTMLMLQDGRAHLCHVGDSRCYRIRPQEARMEQWSRDQNVAAELVEQGVLTADEARHHRASHTLTQAVGLGKPLEPQRASAPLRDAEEELFLLCSDGLLRVFADEEIASLVLDRIVPGEPPAAGENGAEAQVTAAVRDLVTLANRRGSPDNISVILLRLEP